MADNEELVERVARALEGFTLGNPIHAARAAIEATRIEELLNRVERREVALRKAKTLLLCSRSETDCMGKRYYLPDEHAALLAEIDAALTGEHNAR